MRNAHFIKIIITRNQLVIKAKNDILFIKDRNLSIKEVYNKIESFIKKQQKDYSNKMYEWVLLDKVKFKDKFEAYDCIISLDKCICERKEVGINVKNPYNIKKAIKYRFNDDCISNIILVSKINDEEYVVFIKQFKNER